jgi:UDP-N-acetylglucosamine transferase subunit ALG13
MNPSEYEEHIKNASYVVTHGGVGSIMTALKLKKKIIAMPRLFEYGEHVNNHQKQIVEKLSNEGYIKNGTNLKEAIQGIDAFVPKEYRFDNSKIKEKIKDFIN